MKSFRSIAVLSMSIVLSAGVTGCSDDDPAEENDLGNVVAPSVNPGKVDPTVTGVLSTEKAGEYIETTAKELDRICNPQDQAGAVSALTAIADVLDSYEFEDDNINLNMTLATAARTMARGTTSADYRALTRAVQNISNDIEVNPYSMLGIYTPVYNKEYREYVWTRTGDSSNSLVFRSDKDKTEVSLIISHDSWTGKFITYDYDYDYNYDYVNGIWSYQDYDITNHWTVTVPAKVTLDMSYSGSTAASGVVESNFDEAGHKFEVKASAQVANINVNAQTIGTDTKIFEQFDATIGGTRVMYSTGEVNGNGLCDRKKIESLAELSQSQLAAQIDKVFTSANAKVDLLDRIQVMTTGNSLRSIVSNSDFDDESKAETNAFVNALNGNVKTTLYFGNTSYEQGSLVWGTVPVTYWGYTWYEVVPMIQLASGGSPMSLEEVFQNGILDGAAETISDIINAYCRAFNID